jgi:hypothetical protein
MKKPIKCGNARRAATVVMILCAKSYTVGTAPTRLSPQVMVQGKVVALKPTAKPRKAARSSTCSMRRKYRAQRAVAGGIFGISVGVVALSLGHLTQGVIDHTRSDLWQAGLMAAGIDLLMLAHKAGASS